MKNIFNHLFVILAFAACRKNDGNTQELPTETVAINKQYSHSDTLKKLAEEYTAAGVPGIVIAVYSPAEGYWGTAGGYSDVESKTPMNLSNLQYLQSVTKTYLAAAILKLHEEGKINLDAPMTSYLPAHYAAYIDQASSMTIRNLLNHTSGMPDYLENPAYISYALEHPEHIFSSDEFLSYIQGAPRLFAPGTRFSYCNTNYHVLALIADAISGNHDQLIREKILLPAGLTHTHYRDIAGRPELVKNYLDYFGTGDLQNVTVLQQSSITSAKGDDGIVATPFDAVNFLRGLMEGRILSSPSLNEMTDWVNDADGKAIYGMGLYHVEYSNVVGFGHGGAGAGAGCALYYFPEKRVSVFSGTNIGTLADGPLVRKVGELKQKILDIVLKD